MFGGESTFKDVSVGVRSILLKKREMGSQFEIQVKKRCAILMMKGRLSLH